jgi:hypothetical protein
MMVFGFREVVSGNLPFKVLRVMMMAIVILWAKGHERRAAQTSTRSATPRRNGCSCQSQVENEYPACKPSQLAFPLMKGGNVGQIHRM